MSALPTDKKQRYTLLNKIYETGFSTKMSDTVPFGNTSFIIIFLYHKKYILANTGD